MDIKNKEINELTDSLFSDAFSEYPKINPEVDTFVAAQIIENAYNNASLNFRDKISRLIRKRTDEETLDNGIVKEIELFFESMYSSKNNINIITTNYDDLIEKVIFKQEANVYSKASNKKYNGLTRANIFHIHGVVDKPETITITMNDYFNFQSHENYLTHKTYSLLEENTTVILGYSLGDFNINKIINEVNQEKKHLSQNNSIFFVSQRPVDDLKKQYYDSVFGIKVIDEMEIIDFLKNIVSKKEEAELIHKQVESIAQLVNGASFQLNDIKSIPELFDEVIDRMNLMNKNINDYDAVEALLCMLKDKKECTSEDGAFAQYKELADWIISFLKAISWSKISDEHKQKIEEFICFSFRKMSKKLYLGYSWAAHQVWANEWENIPTDSKIDIQNYIIEHRSEFQEKNQIGEIIPEYIVGVNND